MNKQGYIEITNIDADLFETQVNFVQNNPNSVPTTVRKFLQGPGKVLAIEHTINTEDLRKYILIISNKDHPHTIKKIGELLAHLKKEKDTLPTIRSSLAKFKSYPEMNGGLPITESLSDQVAALELNLASQPVPPNDNNVYSSRPDEHLGPSIEYHHYNSTGSSYYHTHIV